MGWRWYKNQWMDDKEYNNTRDTENFMALYLFTWCLPAGISAYLFYILFNSQKIAFIGGGIAFVICIIFRDFMETVLMDWIGTVLTWVFGVAVIITLIAFLVFIFNSLPN